jgi:hypothetical protein
VESGAQDCRSSEWLASHDIAVGRSRWLAIGVRLGMGLASSGSNGSTLPAGEYADDQLAAVKTPAPDFPGQQKSRSDVRVSSNKF